MPNGFATAIFLLAQEQQAGQLTIHPILVITSGEAPATEDREYVCFVRSGRPICFKMVPSSNPGESLTS